MIKKKSAFTLIEMLIVIAVFSIGVLAVLRMLLNNMAVMDSVRAKTVATFLAKEGIALAYSVRDSNRLAALPWNCFANVGYSESASSFDRTQISAGYFASGTSSPLRLLGYSPKYYVFFSGVSADSNFSKMFAAASLSLFSGSFVDGMQWYGYGNAGLPTSFARYVLFTGIVEDGRKIPLDRVLKIESHVLYMQGSATGEVVLESFIGNY